MKSYEALLHTYSASCDLTSCLTEISLCKKCHFAGFRISKGHLAIIDLFKGTVRPFKAGVQEKAHSICCKKLEDRQFF